MKEYVIDEKGAGRRMDKWMASEMPLLPKGLMQKFLRLKRVKRNGKPAKADDRLEAGDVVNAYIPDEFFGKPAPSDPLLASFRPHLSVLYEDENVLITDKRPGLVCHPDGDEKVNTLLTHVRAYLYQKGQYDPAFKPALCNRIDRFTGGVVIAAKNEAAMHEMNDLIRLRLVSKHYLAAIHGAMRPPEGMLDNYIVQREGMRRVLVRRAPEEGAHRALTRYRTLAENGSLSLVDCELITGRTHQIRAQFADAGHPLLGDTQYGDARDETRFGRGFQALYAYGVDFNFAPRGGVLDDLSGLTMRVTDVPFAREYFPDAFVTPSI